MRFLLAVLLIVILSFLAGMFLPWWSLAVVGFLVSWLLLPFRRQGFLAGFIAIFLLWGGLALWVDIKNQSILSEKIARLFPLGGSSVLMILVTALVGGLVGGLAGFTGSSLKLRQ